MSYITGNTVQMADEPMHDAETENAQMPEIYQFQFMPSDMQKTFTEILGDCAVCDVFNSFSQYIGENIEPIGWKAIWKPILCNYPKDTTFRVNVVDVYYKTLEASIVIMSIIYPKPANLTADEHQQIEPLLRRTEVLTVRLIDLYVISSEDDTGTFYNTAYLIELLRLFYTNIWRPWDDLNESIQSEPFVATRLRSRLALTWDIKSKIISQNLSNRFNSILSESFAIKEKMNNLNARISEDCDSKNDAESYVTEIDATEYIRLKMKLQDLEREMLIIEDNHLRSLYFTLMTDQCDEYDSAEQEHASVHLVLKKLTSNSLLNSLQNLNKTLSENGRSDWPLKMHSSLRKAITSARSGDAIYLTPGIYEEPLPWIENDIEIIGTENSVVLSSHQDSGDVFLFVNCQSTVRLFNLLITANHQLNNLVVIKSGHLILDHCTLDCNRSMTQSESILVVPNGTASIEKQNGTTILNCESKNIDTDF